MKCEICDYKYANNRFKIGCNKCKYFACHQCYKKYIIFSETPEIKCMSCFKEFDDEDFFSQMPKDYKKQNEIRLGDLIYKKMEKNIPRLAEWVETEKKCRIADEEIKQNKILIASLRKKLRECVENVKYEEYHIAQARKNAIKTITGEKCCVVDCNGLTDDKNICRICNVEMCIICKCIKNTEHICDKDQLETLKMIKETSVNCPNCDVSISKSEGCNDMFCVSCHTKFHYESLKIIHHQIHNPHLEEYDKTTALNECEPINMPPRELIFLKDDPIDDNVCRYLGIVGSIGHNYVSIKNKISEIQEYVSNIESDRRKYRNVVASIINPEILTNIKILLLEDSRYVESLKKTLVILETFLKMVCDILWYLAEHSNKNFKLEKLNIQDNDYRTAINKYNEVYDWTSSEIACLIQYKVNTQVWSISYQSGKLVETGYM